MASTVSLSSRDVAVLDLLRGSDRVVLTAFADQPDRPILSLIRSSCRAGEPGAVRGIRTLTPEEYESFQHLLDAGLLRRVPRPRFAQGAAFLVAFQNQAVETREAEFAFAAPATVLAHLN